MPGHTQSDRPPTAPMLAFEDNAKRVRALIEIHKTLTASRGKPPRWQCDIAAAAIVMVLAAADTYFNDRLTADFERRLDRLNPEHLGRYIRQIPSTELVKEFVSALQSPRPRRAFVEHLRETIAAATYQEPGAIKDHLKIFGLTDIWGDASFCWQKRYGGKKLEIEKMFREWAERRHGIAHRAGRSRAMGSGPALTKARRGGLATREEAVDCLEFFERLIALVDYRLNDQIYGRQPRHRVSEIAVFDLTPLPAARVRKNGRAVPSSSTSRVAGGTAG